MTLIKTAALAAMAACSMWGGDFFPLQNGNTWTYRESTTGQTFTIRVGTPVLTDDRVYSSLRGYTDSPLLVRVDERGELVVLDPETGSERVLTSFTPFEGGRWEAPFRQCDSLGQTQEKRATHDGRVGPISGVLEIRYRVISCADAGVLTEQYAENIGMVQRVTNTIAGPRRFDLVYARVGKAEIDASRNGRFSVAAEQALDGLAITWRLATSTGESLRLQFSSGQEYDVIMRDDAGRVVWQWSAGRAFTQDFHERSVSVWSASVLAPIANLMAGNYTVESWITTSGNPPAFAATVPVTIR
jgi:hypothetical protein